MSDPVGKEPTEALHAIKVELLEGAKNPQRLRTIENVWSVLIRRLHAGEAITAAAVGKLCVERFGGPRPQSISNDQLGLARLVRAFSTAQDESMKVQKVARVPAHGKRRSEILDGLTNPRLRSLVHEIFDEAASLRRELQLAKGLFNKAQLSRQGEVMLFGPPEISQEQRVALKQFLDEETLFQIGLKLEFGEVRTQRGITVFRKASVAALKKIIDKDDTTDDQS